MTHSFCGLLLSNIFVKLPPCLLTSFGWGQIFFCLFSLFSPHMFVLFFLYTSLLPHPSFLCLHVSRFCFRSLRSALCSHISLLQFLSFLQYSNFQCVLFGPLFPSVYSTSLAIWGWFEVCLSEVLVPLICSSPAFLTLESCVLSKQSLHPNSFWERVT